MKSLSLCSPTHVCVYRLDDLWDDQLNKNRKSESMSYIANKQKYEWAILERCSSVVAISLPAVRDPGSIPTQCYDSLGKWMYLHPGQPIPCEENWVPSALIQEYEEIWQTPWWAMSLIRFYTCESIKFFRVVRVSLLCIIDSVCRECRVSGVWLVL